MAFEYSSLIPAGMALIGVFGGSYATYLANSKIKSNELAQQIKREEVAYKRSLYAKFVSETNISAIKSMDEKSASLKNIESSSALLSEIELVSCPVVLKNAQDMVSSLLNMYAVEPDKSKPHLSEVRKLFISSVKSELDKYT